MDKLIIKDAKVLFVEIKDADYGSSITIDASDENMRKNIEQYFQQEGLTPKFKEYTNEKTGETTKQFSIKLATFVKVQDEDGNDYDLDGIEKHQRDAKLGYGATINLAIRSYDYENKFGKGKSASASAIRITKGAEFKDDMADLL